MLRPKDTHKQANGAVNNDRDTEFSVSLFFISRSAVQSILFRNTLNFAYPANRRGKGGFFCQTNRSPILRLRHETENRRSGQAISSPGAKE